MTLQVDTSSTRPKSEALGRTPMEPRTPKLEEQQQQRFNGFN
ncbi:hypothetical protein PR003_g13168 [Phytophthora rubi]|uniref:Uncharacterized protein n=1 Tax=Phytophthora rubi TaxID=129364 RepID=A0A6A4F7H6_9STRA|nr:hypothetical protein PR003_g13168 [Phytophthora rubi]